MADADADTDGEGAVPHHPHAEDHARLTIANAGFNNRQRQILGDCKKKTTEVLRRCRLFINDRHAPVAQFQELLEQIDTTETETTLDLEAVRDELQEANRTAAVAFLDDYWAKLHNSCKVAVAEMKEAYVRYRTTPEPTVELPSDTDEDAGDPFDHAEDHRLVTAPISIQEMHILLEAGLADARAAHQEIRRLQDEIRRMGRRRSRSHSPPRVTPRPTPAARPLPPPTRTTPVTPGGIIDRLMRHAGYPPADAGRRQEAAPTDPPAALPRDPARAPPPTAGSATGGADTGGNHTGGAGLGGGRTTGAARPHTAGATHRPQSCTGAPNVRLSNTFHNSSGSRSGRRRRRPKKSPPFPHFDPSVPPPPLPTFKGPFAPASPSRRSPPRRDPPPPDHMPLGASAASISSSASSRLRDPTLSKYQHLMDRYQNVAAANPFQGAGESVPASYYFTLPPPWNVAPSARARQVDDYHRVEGSAPKFDGRPEGYLAWRSLFIPAVHQARADLAWKASLLLRSLDTSKSTRLLNIIGGLSGMEDGYRATIERLEDAYGHPLGILGGRLREIEIITEVRSTDFLTIEKLKMRLEDYLNDLEKMNQPHEMFSHRLFEDLYNKLDKRLGQAFLIWHNNNLPTNPPSPISMLAWLKVQTRNAQTAYNARQRRQPTARHEVHFAHAADVVPPDCDVLDSAPPPPDGPDECGGGLAHAFVAAAATPKCPLDGLPHKIITCDKFKAASPPDRRRTLARDDRCFACFKKGHKVPKCTKGITCTICLRSHHTLLHMTPKKDGRATILHTTMTDGNDSDDSTASQAVFHAAAPSDSKVSLHTVPVLVTNPSNHHSFRLNCMLDSGATATFLSARAAKQLRLVGYPYRLKLKGVEGLTRNITVASAQVELVTPNGRHSIFVRVSDDPVAAYAPVDWSVLKENFDHLRDLQVPPPVPHQPVDLLLGQDAAHLMAALQPDVCAEDGRGPVARRSLLGWSVGGTTDLPATAADSRALLVFRAAIAEPTPLRPSCGDEPWSAITFLPDNGKEGRKPPAEDSNAALTAAVLRRLDEEAAPEGATISFTDQLVFQHLQSEMKMVNGRYQVPVLWKKFPPPINNNYNYALARLVALEKSRSFQDPELRQQYMGQIDDWLSANFVEPVTTDTPADDKAYYIPHMAVINMGKVSSRLRIVMDAAAAPKNETPLNAHVHKGPKLINELVEVLLRFRKDRVAVIADIEKMFHNISMPEQDRDYHRFLWREAPSLPLQIYRWVSHVFGNAGSPCVAIATVKTHAGNHRAEFPLAADTLIHSTLVDDSLDSVPDVDTAVRLLDQLRRLLALMGMTIKKVAASSPEVMQHVPASEHSPSLLLEDFCGTEEQMPVIKTLGVIYIAAEDHFSFTLHIPDDPHKWTKRSLLSFEARLYDPHGLLLPHTVAARILLQQAWRAQLGWDEELPRPLLQRWQEWLDSLHVLPTIRVPRAAFPTGSPPVQGQQLHIFSDASDEACAAVAYLVTHFGEAAPPVARLLIAKAKVAPLKKLSVPRLELVAATLSLDLLQCVARTYAIPLAHTFCWVDSVNVLCWIRNDSRALSTFVGNRVAKIQRSTWLHHWKFVDSAQNPADIPSRGVLANAFCDNSLWWNGLEFLVKPEQEPAMPAVVHAPQASQELKKGTQFAFISQNFTPCTNSIKDGYRPDNDTSPFQFSKFSSFRRLIRVIAWCRRTLHPLPVDTLQPQELKEAERTLWKIVQKSSFAATWSDLSSDRSPAKQSNVVKLRPQIFPDGLIRLGGRLRLLPVPHNEKHPILLPKDHPAVHLLVRQTHEELLHAGPGVVLTRLLKQFWIVQGRKLVRHVISRCILCKRRTPQPMQQRMADLPDTRCPVEGAQVFQHIGLDMAGPYFIRNKPDKFIHKRYFAIFTCLLSRAVHLESLATANTDSFLAAFERFTNRRGRRPESVVCDNGSNIKAASLELARLQQTKSKIRDKHPDITWRFIPPTGSHYGGIYERLVAAVKKSLKAALPDHSPISDEHFATLLAAVEGILNARPLTYISQDPADPQPLCPADALGAAHYSTLTPEPEEWSLKKQWHQNQRRLDVFWERLRGEVIPFFQVTSKWHKETRAPRPGDVVTMLDDQCRGAWPLAVVEDTEISHDGRVRTVTIRYRSGDKNRRCRRPISSLCLLLPQQD